MRTRSCDVNSLPHVLQGTDFSAFVWADRCACSSDADLKESVLQAGHGHGPTGKRVTPRVSIVGPRAKAGGSVSPPVKLLAKLATEAAEPPPPLERTWLTEDVGIRMCACCC